MLLTELLRGLLADFQRTSGADLLSLSLFDEATGTYYAPFALGLREEGLEESLLDMGEQLARYKADASQGKAPRELGFTHYGSTVWLTVSKRPLVARDAQKEVDSSFVRRHQVRSLIGLPLIAGDRLVGLVYLNYLDAARAPGPEKLTELEGEAAAAAAAIQKQLGQAEKEALATIERLSRELAAASGSANFGHSLAEVLADLRAAAGLEALAVYQHTGGGRLALAAQQGVAGLPATIPVPQDPDAWEQAVLNATGAAIGELHLVAALALAAERPQGLLLALSRDRVAIPRLAPAAMDLLETSAQLLGGSLAAQRLVATLEDTNRVLGALSRLSNAMLRPGSSRREVLEAVVNHLTSAEVPEFDFQLAGVYLLEEVEPGRLAVRMAAGSEPLDQERDLAPDDVLCYVARNWQVVAVGPLGGGELLAGYQPDQLLETSVPAVRADGSTAASVPVALVAAGGRVPDPPFTLAGDIFEARRHAELIRVFLPFGRDSRARATGVLELGYERSRKRPLERTQVEALRAAAAQVAVALETARLYEDARRHAEQLELSRNVSQAIASSIDLDQTLRLVARNLVRLVDASLCQIALYEEDGYGWYGAAASEGEEAWRRQRGERPAPSFLFEVLDRRAPLVIDDAAHSELVSPEYVQLFGVRSLLALPLLADGQPIGAAVLARTGEVRPFSPEEAELAGGLSDQAAIAIKNARLHAFAEEERHLEKDFILVGFGMWGQKTYQHLLTLKQFFNFKISVVQLDAGMARVELASRAEEVRATGDAFYWDSEAEPAYQQLARDLESSRYVITYIATPAASHLATLARFYDLSDVIVVEKPLGAAPDAYREFLDSVPPGVEIVAADHYYFKLEVRLLQLLLSEERTLRAFLDSVEQIEVEILEEQPLTGAAADIGVVADLIPHAFAIVSLFTPIGRIQLDPAGPLLIGRQEPLQGTRETYARMKGSFPYQGRSVRLVIDMGKGVEDSKWIKLSADLGAGGRGSFYKFDFGRGEAIDGTQAAVRAARRTVRQPGVPDNAHLTMLRHVIEKRRPAVGILSIREALRSNQRIQELEALAGRLLEKGEWTLYGQGHRPDFSRRTGTSASR